MPQTVHPFSGIKIGFLSIGDVLSEIKADGVQRPLQWQRDTENHYIARDEAGDFRLSVEMVPGGVRLTSSARLRTAVEHLSFSLLAFSALPLDHYFCCGERMGRCRSVKLPVSEKRQFTGRHIAVLTRQGQNILFSTPLKQRLDNEFFAQAAGSQLLDFRLVYTMDHCDLTDLLFDPVTIVAGNVFERLQDYAMENREVKRDFSSVEYGWNSWDYYRWTITEEEVIHNAEFIAGDPVLRKHIRRIIVDDGWQSCYGEWKANWKFPSGLAALARRLRRLGFVPGLWVAPSIVEPVSRIAQMDYDMLAQSEGGQPCLAYECMKRYGFVLDPTVPKSQEFLRKTFDELSAAGYGYFKLDFLAATMNARRFANRRIPRSQILRLLMEAVTEGIRGRAQVLGCNYHFYNGNSYVQAVRTGADVHSRWSDIKVNTPSVAGMFWANKRLWLNDPDFALCRSMDTADDPELNQLNPCNIYITPDMAYDGLYDYKLATTSLVEQQTLLSIVIMAGGAVNLSDNLPRLNALGLQLARKVVSAESGEAAIPMDLFESELPSRWFQRLSSGGHRLLLINWEDIPREITVHWEQIGGRPTQIVDFWSDSELAVADCVALPPHACALWQF